MTTIEARELIERDKQLLKIRIIRNKETCDLQELIKANDELFKIVDKFEYRKKNALSMRIGMIIVLEDSIVNSRVENRSSYSFETIYGESKSRFALSTSNKTRFKNDLDYIHPQNPRSKFIQLHRDYNFRYEKLVSEYKKALIKIIVSHAWYVDNDKVTVSLKLLIKSPLFN